MQSILALSIVDELPIEQLLDIYTMPICGSCLKLDKFCALKPKPVLPITQFSLTIIFSSKMEFLITTLSLMIQFLPILTPLPITQLLPIIDEL